MVMTAMMVVARAFADNDDDDADEHGAADHVDDGDDNTDANSDDDDVSGDSADYHDAGGEDSPVNGDGDNDGEMRFMMTVMLPVSSLLHD